MFTKFAVFILGLFVAFQPASAQKRKVSVMPFGYATVRTSVQAYFGTDQDIGKGISDLLINQLLEGGNYRVIERSALDKIIKEQNFSNSDRANPASAAKIGGLLGVDAMIIGDITMFGGEDKHTGLGGAGCAFYHGCGLGGIGISKSKTIVEITARLVDVNTGEILASVQGRGEINKGGVSLAGGGFGGSGGGGGTFDMGSSNFQQSVIGQAVKLSVTQLATNLDTKVSVIPAAVVVAPPPPPPLDGVIADASTSDIILNVGSKDGLKPGESLNILRQGKVIKDPVTGKVLRTMETSVGTLTVTSVDADSSVAKLTSTGTPKVGDHVKRPTAP